jgi:hypothetical protein
VCVGGGQGGESVTVVGTNLGPLNAAFAAPNFVNYTSGGRTFTAVNCTTLTLAPSTPDLSSPNLQQTVCLSAPGVGAGLLWTVTRVGLVSPPFAMPGGPTPTQSASRYTPPAIAAVVPAVAPFATRGQQSVTLRGSNFGPADLAPLVTYGPVEERGARWVHCTAWCVWCVW